MPVQFQIVLFAVIAAFVLFQLYNVLGKKVGRQPEDDVRAQPAGAAPAVVDANAKTSAVDPHTLSAVQALKARDPAFDPARFLDGARQAHETIVRGYAAGDREALKPLLAPAVMASFETGIAAREARGETAVADFVHPPRADLEIATVENDKALARVRFLAELRQTVSAPGLDDVVEDRRTAEIWTFQRPLGANDPNWVLARVEPASA